MALIIMTNLQGDWLVEDIWLHIKVDIKSVNNALRSMATDSLKMCLWEQNFKFICLGGGVGGGVGGT